MKLKTVEAADGCKAVIIDGEGIVFNGERTAILFMPETATKLNITKGITEVNLEVVRRRWFREVAVEEGHGEYFGEGNVLYSADKRKLCASVGSNEVVSVIAECEEISESAFSGTALREVHFLGSNVKYIHASAFSGVNVTSITFKDGLLECKNFVFSGSLIKRVYFPSTLRFIGELCFLNSHIEEVDFSKASKINFEPKPFEGCAKLFNVLLPKSQDTISQSMFIGCSSLSTISIPSTVTRLMGSAFLRSGVREVVFEGEGLEWIGEQCFSRCNEMERISIPRSVKEISAEAFSHCGKLRSIEIAGDSRLERIGKGLIKESNGVEKIFLGEFVRGIPECGLSESYGLMEIEVSAKNEFLRGSDGVVYSKDNRTLVACAGGKRRVEIPRAVERINGSAFFNCRMLEEVIFDRGAMVAEIESQTFFGCSGIAGIEFPSKLRRIVAEALKGCALLERVEFDGESELEEVGASAFEECGRLERAVLPRGVRAIKGGSFSRCVRLEVVVLPRGIEMIEALSFRGDIALERVEFCSGRMPEGVDETAFAGCERLSFVLVPIEFAGEVEEFGGVKVLRVLDGDCLCGTNNFTGQGRFRAGSEFIMSILSSSLSETESESENENESEKDNK